MEIPSLPGTYSHIPKKLIYPVVIVLFLIFLPLLIYHFLPQQPFTHSFSIDKQTSKMDPEVKFSFSTLNNNLENSDLTVDIKATGTLSQINLADLKLNFGPSFEVVSVVTPSGQAISKRLEYFKIENQSSLNILVGFLNPVVEENLEMSESVVLATVGLKVKNPNLALEMQEFTFLDTSSVYASTSNKSIEWSSDVLKLDLKDLKPIKNNKQPALITYPTYTKDTFFTTPQGGQVYSYFDPLDISWEGSYKRVDLALYIDGQYSAKLTPVGGITQINSFKWEPSRTIPLSLAKGENYFQIEFTAEDKAKKVYKYLSNPVALSLEKGQNKIESDKDIQIDFNDDSKVNSEDISLFLSNFGLSKLNNPRVDLNGDGVVNGVDIWILKTKLIN